MFFCLVSLWTVYRVRTYSAPTFDFGIFSQMFFQMKETGLPYTTVERDGLLSHFFVHVSPIYYLMLPFYCLFPTPVTLQVLQAAVIASAVIPTWKLTRKHGCTPFAGVLICIILLLYPAFCGGVSYDLHENAFLLPLVLWLFYAIDCEKRWAVFIFGILTLMVKEDAAVYVAVIALWLLIGSLLNKNRRQRWGVATGCMLLGCALLWFFLVTGYLTRYGDGLMTYRYNNFIYDDSNSLFTVVKAALLSPMKVIYECTEPDRLPFLALTMLPVCGIFLFTRKYERYILLIPYILVNLMPDYKYQHDVFYQYTYGSMACLFYLTIVNYEDIPEKGKKQFSLIAAFVISTTCFVRNIVPQAIRYPLYFYRQKEHFQEVQTLLETIPKGASVTATTFYTTPLSQRDILYDVRHSSLENILSTEYVVLDLRDKYSYDAYSVTEDDGYENLTELLEEKGYRVVGEMQDEIMIYKYYQNGLKAEGLTLHPNVINLLRCVFCKP